MEGLVEDSRKIIDAAGVSIQRQILDENQGIQLNGCGTEQVINTLSSTGSCWSILMNIEAMNSSTCSILTEVVRWTRSHMT
jgi:hypothetical protein